MSETHNQLYATQSALACVESKATSALLKVDALRDSADAKFKELISFSIEELARMSLRVPGSSLAQLRQEMRAEIDVMREEIDALKSGTTIKFDLLAAAVTPTHQDAMKRLLTGSAEVATKAEASIFKTLNPADLPADQLLNYDQIVHLMGPDPLRRQTIEKYALNEGYEDRIPRGFRRSPKTAVVWRAADIAEFFNCKPSVEVAK